MALVCPRYLVEGKMIVLGRACPSYIVKRFFLKTLPLLYFFVPVSSRKIIQSVRKSSPICSSVHMRSFLPRLKGEVDYEIAYPET